MIFTVTVCIGFWLDSEHSGMVFAYPRAAFHTRAEADTWGYDSIARIHREQSENESIAGCSVGEYHFSVEEFPIY